MLLTVGEKVVYPCQGPCLIEQVVKKVVAGRLTRFYRSVVLDSGGGKLLVPVDKAPGIGIRQLLERSEIPKLLGRLEKAGGIPEVNSTVKNWRQRAMDSLKMFSTGSAFDLAEIVESLTHLSETKSLSTRDKWTLERARRLLVCEISEVMGEAKSAAEEQVDKALAARKER